MIGTSSVLGVEFTAAWNRRLRSNVASEDPVEACRLLRILHRDCGDAILELKVALSSIRRSPHKVHLEDTIEILREADSDINHSLTWFEIQPSEVHGTLGGRIEAMWIGMAAMDPWKGETRVLGHCHDIVEKLVAHFTEVVLFIELFPPVVLDRLEASREDLIKQLSKLESVIRQLVKKQRPQESLLDEKK